MINLKSTKYYSEIKRRKKAKNIQSKELEDIIFFFLGKDMNSKIGGKTLTFLV